MPRRINNTIVPRNPVAKTLATRRGGVHEQSRSAARQRSRASLQNQLTDWREELEFEREISDYQHVEVGSADEPTEQSNFAVLILREPLN